MDCNIGVWNAQGLGNQKREEPDIGVGIMHKQIVIAIRGIVVDMVLLWNNIMSYLTNRMESVQFVIDTVPPVNVCL